MARKLVSSLGERHVIEFVRMNYGKLSEERRKWAGRYILAYDRTGKLSDKEWAGMERCYELLMDRLCSRP